MGGAGVFWGENDPRNASYPLLSALDERGCEIEVTSIRAELMAAYFAVKDVRKYWDDDRFDFVHVVFLD